jgi:nucleoid-associated protein YgaU
MFDSRLDSEQAFDRIRAMGRTRVRGRRTAVFTAVMVVAASWASPLARAFGGPEQPVPVAEHRYVVHAGDTLWSIARSISPGRDPRPVVDAIAQANDVDPGALVPGRTLVIPTAG